MKRASSQETMPQVCTRLCRCVAARVAAVPEAPTDLELLCCVDNFVRAAPTPGTVEMRRAHGGRPAFARWRQAAVAATTRWRRERRIVVGYIGGLDVVVGVRGGVERRHVVRQEVDNLNVPATATEHARQ